MKTIYEAMVEANVEISNWCSDMYVEVSPVTEEILGREEYALHKKNAVVFISEVEPHTPHFDIPFAYDPYHRRS